ncbi:MAG: lipoprotein [Alphaproteobacteria bacterium]|nr:lipoprotein [Alphaproteobacteria bacterium]
MRALIIMTLLASLAACGVQGDLYRPTDPKPDPKKRERGLKTHPFPDQPPEEQEVMPDLI